MIDTIIGIIANQTFKLIFGGPHPAQIIFSLYSKIIYKLSNILIAMLGQSKLNDQIHDIIKDIEQFKRIGININYRIPSSPHLPVFPDETKNLKEFYKKVKLFTQACHEIITNLNIYVEEGNKLAKVIQYKIYELKGILKNKERGHVFEATMIRQNNEALEGLEIIILPELKSVISRVNNKLKAYKNVLNIKNQ